jgi:hypothetical protein
MGIDGMERGDSIEEGRRTPLRVREHGSDVNRIAVVAAERSVDKAFGVHHFLRIPSDVLYFSASTNIN